MTSAIEQLIDANVRCVKCGEPRGCACWILLRCRHCNKQRMTERLPHDFPEAVRVEITCPDCARGDFDETLYYDKDGKHITREPLPVEMAQGG